MSSVDVTQLADCRAILGAPGTGKSHYVKNLTKADKRLLVWDLEDEFDLPAVPLAQLARYLHSNKQFRVKVVGSADKKRRTAEFDIFCNVAFHIGKLRVLVEELRFVTTPSYAPEAWAGLTLRGRKRGIKVIGTSQRPAQIDKDFLGCCTLIRTGALNFPADRKAVADVIGCTTDNIAALQGYDAIEWTRSPRKLLLPKGV